MLAFGRVSASRSLNGYDFFILLTGIALLGNRDESCVDDLAAAGLEALGA